MDKTENINIASQEFDNKVHKLGVVTTLIVFAGMLFLAPIVTPLLTN